MEQSERIQSSKQTTRREREIIDLLVNNQTPESAVSALRFLIQKRYGFVDDGSRRTRMLLIRSAIGNSLRYMTPFTTIMIGKALGKDHATVVHQSKMHEVYLQSFPEYVGMFDLCCDFLRNNFSSDGLTVESRLALSHKELKAELRLCKKKIKHLRELVVMYSHALTANNIDVKKRGG